MSEKYRIFAEEVVRLLEESGSLVHDTETELRRRLSGPESPSELHITMPEVSSRVVMGLADEAVPAPLDPAKWGDALKDPKYEVLLGLNCRYVGSVTQASRPLHAGPAYVYALFDVPQPKADVSQPDTDLPPLGIIMRSTFYSQEGPDRHEVATAEQVQDLRYLVARAFGQD